ERGLALDRLSRSHSRLAGSPTDVAELARLATHVGRRPAVRGLGLPGALQNIEWRASLAGLRSCSFDHRLSSPELTIIANLALESLDIDVSSLGPTPIDGPLCRSLTRLRLSGDVSSPNLLRGFSRLKS